MGSIPATSRDGCLFEAGIRRARGVLALEEWQQLLEQAGVKHLSVKTGKVERLSNPWEDLADVVRSLPKVIRIYRSSPIFRKFFNVVRSLPDGLLDYFGYGLFIGAK